MLIEKEIFGLLDTEAYDMLEVNLVQEYGLPVLKKRLSVAYWDPDVAPRIDPRFRLTNGIAEVMIKKIKTDESSLQVREEYRTEVSNDIGNMVDTIEMLSLIYNKHREPVVQKFKNKIWTFQDVEIKLTEQSGGETCHSFEVEVSSDRIDINKVLDQFKLRGYVTHRDVSFWKDWDKKVNQNLSEVDLEELLIEYSSN